MAGQQANGQFGSLTAGRLDDIAFRIPELRPCMMLCCMMLFPNGRKIRTIVPKMRTVKPLDALLGKTRQRVLAQTYLNPERWWYLHELARTLDVRPSSIQRDLSILVAAGILSRRRNGNRVYFKAEPACPVFPELRSLLIKTIGVVDVLREALQPAQAAIDIAFVYGSMATAEERATSDVDLMLIGSVRPADVAASLKSAERQLGRSVNATVYAPGEFGGKLQQGHHFLKNVMAGPKLFIYGSDSELEHLVSERAREAPQNEPPRNRRSARGR